MILMVYARRRSTTARKRLPIVRRRKRGRRIPLFFKFLVCVGIIVGVILYAHQKKPLPSFLERAREVEQLVLAQLSRMEIPQQAIQKRREEMRKGKRVWTSARWEITLPSGVDADKVSPQLVEGIGEIPPGVTLAASKTQDGAAAVAVKVDDLLTLYIIFRPPTVAPPKPLPCQPRIAIVVDDLGLDKQAAEELLRLEAPLTFSILPFQPHSRRIAQLAHAQGKEIILHLPMEPRGFPLKDPGEGGLFVTMGETTELARQLKKDLDAVPYISGANNHMGSRFMEHEAVVRVVLKELKKRGLFFLDSGTTDRSMGYQVARELSLKAGKRDIFLDNETGPKDMEVQLDHLIRIARQRGKAIGIGHPYPSTVAALKGMIAKIQKVGIKIVPLSRVLDE
jgi:polysaccharide deacetylase 2 family uncharacterized protein YibQ